MSDPIHEKCINLKEEEFSFSGSKGLQSVNNPSLHKTAYCYRNAKGDYLLTLKECDKSHGRMMKKSILEKITSFDETSGDIVFPSAQEIVGTYPQGSMLVTEVKGENDSVAYIMPHIPGASPFGRWLEERGTFEFSSFEDFAWEVENNILSTEELNMFLFGATDYSGKTLEEIKEIFIKRDTK